MNAETVAKRLEELQAQAKQQEAVLLQIVGAITDDQFVLN